METPDAGMILQAAQFNAEQVQQIPQNMPSLDKAQQFAGNQMKLKAGVMEMQQMEQEQSDNQKLSQAMSSVDPNSPNYADDVVKAAQQAGVSGKALLNLKQNLYIAEGEKLKVDQSKLTIQESVGKLSDQQSDRLATVVDSFHSHLAPLITDYQQTVADGKGNDPTTLATFAARRDASIREMTEQLQQMEQNGTVDKKTADAQIQALQKQIGTPYNPQIIQKEYETSSAWKTELDNKKAELANQKEQQSVDANLPAAQAAEARAKAEQARADAAAAGKQVVTGETTDADGNKVPTYSVIDKGTGATTATGVVAAPKGTTSAGGRDSVYTSRIISSGEEALGDIKNAMELPLDSNAGWLSSKKTSDGGILSSIRSGLANKMTSQDAQNYQVVASGLQRNLAAIESAGLAPAGSLTHQMDAVVIQPGDSIETALRKLAQSRQIVENGLKNVLNKPNVNAEQKQEVQGILDGMKEAIPFTMHDITQWKKDGSKQSFQEYVANKGLGQAGQQDISTTSSSGTSVSNWSSTTSSSGTSVSNW